MFACALVSSVEHQDGDKRRGHDDSSERCTSFVQERIHDLFEREKLALFVVRELVLLFLNVSSSVRDVGVHGLLSFRFLGELMHLDRGRDEGLVREDDVQQEREQDDGRDNDRDDHVRGVVDELDIKSTGEHEVGRVGGDEDR